MHLTNKQLFWRLTIKQGQTPSHLQRQSQRQKPRRLAVAKKSKRNGQANSSNHATAMATAGLMIEIGMALGTTKAMLGNVETGIAKIGFFRDVKKQKKVEFMGLSVSIL